MQKAKERENMLKARFISNCTLDNIEEIKIASLYFDKIEIVQHRLYQVKITAEGKLDEDHDIGVITGITELVTEEFRSHLSLLEKEGIVTFIEENKDELWRTLHEHAYNIIDRARDFIFQTVAVVKPGEIITVKFSDEAKRIHELFEGPLEAGKDVHFMFLNNYYAELLCSLLKSMAIGEQNLTQSSVLNNFLKYLYQKKEMTKYLNAFAAEIDEFPSVGFEAIQLAVPDVSAFSMDDILEVRTRLKDELMQFRDEMDTLRMDILKNHDIEYIKSHFSEIAKVRIKPAIKELSLKLDNLKFGVSKKLLKEIRNPLSFAPLLGTVFVRLPIHLAYFISMGLIGMSAALEFIQSKSEIQKNGFYYLIALKEELS